MSRILERITSMGEQELEHFGKEHGLTMDDREFESLAEARAYVAKELLVEKKGDGPAGADLDEEVTAYAREHNCTYSEALAALAKDPGFKRRWEMLFE
jgi:hypothetical protein